MLALVFARRGRSHGSRSPRRAASKVCPGCACHSSAAVAAPPLSTRRSRRDRRRSVDGSIRSPPTSAATCRRSCSPASFGRDPRLGRDDRLTSALIMLVTRLVPVFMWLIGLHQADARAGRPCRSCRRTTSTSSAASPTLRAFNRGQAQAGRSPKASEGIAGDDVTLRVAFSPGRAELAATLGVALVAVTVGCAWLRSSRSRPLVSCSHPSSTSRYGSARVHTAPTAAGVAERSLPLEDELGRSAAAPPASPAVFPVSIPQRVVRIPVSRTGGAR